MVEESSAPEQVAKVKSPDAGGKSPLLTVVLILNCLILGAVAFMQYSLFKKQASEETVRDIIKAEMQSASHEKVKVEGAEKAGEGSETKLAGEKEEDGILFPLEAFTANLAQGDGPRRFVRMDAVLKFSKDSKEDEFKIRKPQIRDRIISILNSKRPEDLLKVEGKSYLKEEIKAAINSFLVDGQVIDVYYVGFQIN